MIKKFHVENYKALRDVTIDLTPVHVLIGPNDSGKTSILEALAALCRSVDHQLADAFLGAWAGRRLVWGGEPELVVRLAADIAGEHEVALRYVLTCRFPETARAANLETETAEIPSGEINFHKHGLVSTSVFQHIYHGLGLKDDEKRAARQVHDALVGVHYYRWDGAMLALPVVSNSKRRYRMEPSGFGLAQCLDDILGHDPQRFLRLQERFKQIFPDVESIRLVVEPACEAPPDDPQMTPMVERRADGKGIYIKFKGQKEAVRASQASDGVLLVLAYLTLLYLPTPPRLLLLEEPENGIHPQRLKDVLGILREVARQEPGTQILMTTHSPYAVDLFEPGEVTVCQRREDGSIAVRRLSESKKVREQMDIFTLGEIWTGVGDAALIESAKAPEDDSR